MAAAAAVEATVVSQVAAPKATVAPAAAAVKTAPKRNCHAQHITRSYAAASMFCSLDSNFYRMSEFQVVFAFISFFFLSGFFSHSSVCSLFRSFSYNLKCILFTILFALFPLFQLKMFCYLIRRSIRKRGVIHNEYGEKDSKKYEAHKYQVKDRMKLNEWK